MNTEITEYAISAYRTAALTVQRGELGTDRDRARNEMASIRNGAADWNIEADFDAIDEEAWQTRNAETLAAYESERRGQVAFLLEQRRIIRNGAGRA